MEEDIEWGGKRERERENYFINYDCNEFINESVKWIALLSRWWCDRKLSAFKKFIRDKFSIQNCRRSQIGRRSFQKVVSIFRDRIDIPYKIAPDSASECFKNVLLIQRLDFFLLNLYLLMKFKYFALLIRAMRISHCENNSQLRKICNCLFSTNFNTNRCIYCCFYCCSIFVYLFSLSLPLSPSLEQKTEL